MKILILSALLFSLNTTTLFSQCTNQVLNLSGTSVVNGISVEVTSSGVVDSNSDYCDSTMPYFIGYNYISGSSGNGSYTFTFSPAIDAATLNFSGISNLGGSSEEVKLFVNGLHYAIPEVGSASGCDALAVLTTSGDIAGCAECSVSGWNGTTIAGPIYSLEVADSVIAGIPSGAIFSLFICNETTIGVEEKTATPNLQFFPNPFTTETRLQTNRMMQNASLIIYNSLGQEVKQVNAISGQSVTVSRDNLPEGLYFVYLTQDDRTVAMGKWIVAD